MVYFVYLFAYSMTNSKRLMYCTPKMFDNACSLHCYDTADNNVKVHWHYRSPKCARPGRISGTLCLNAPFARVCENSYFYEMVHVIIKCRVTFRRKMFNDCIKPHSICMRLVLSTQEEFLLKRAHYGHSPLHFLKCSMGIDYRQIMSFFRNMKLSVAMDTAGQNIL